MDLLQGLRCTFRQSAGWLQGPLGLRSRVVFLLEEACARGQTDDETSQHQTRRDEGWEEREERPSGKSLPQNLPSTGWWQVAGWHLCTL